MAQGRIFTDAALPELSEAGRRAAYLAMAAALAALHSVNPAAVGLQGFGKASGYCKRQARTPAAALLASLLRVSSLWYHLAGTPFACLH